MQDLRAVGVRNRAASIGGLERGRRGAQDSDALPEVKRPDLTFLVCPFWQPCVAPKGSPAIFGCFGKPPVGTWGFQLILPNCSLSVFSDSHGSRQGISNTAILLKETIVGKSVADHQRKYRSARIPLEDLGEPCGQLQASLETGLEHDAQSALLHLSVLSASCGLCRCGWPLAPWLQPSAGGLPAGAAQVTILELDARVLVAGGALRSS